MPDDSPILISGALLLTRERGRELAMSLPRVKEIVLDFKAVEAMSPSFLDELIRGLHARGIESIVLRNVSDRTAENLRRLKRLDTSPARDLEVQVG